MSVTDRLLALVARQFRLVAMWAAISLLWAATAAVEAVRLKSWLVFAGPCISAPVSIVVIVIALRAAQVAERNS